MLLTKILLIGLILMSASGVSAWGEETPIEENETLNIGFNPYLNSSIPYEYTYDREIMNMPFTMGSYTSNDAIAVCTVYTIYKQIWDGSGYIQMTDCNITIETCVNLNYDPVSDTYSLPENWDEVTSNGFMVKKYFQELINSDSEYCSSWNNSDEVDHPDIFYTTVDVDVEDGENYWAYAYISLDSEGEEELHTGDQDYGFALDGRGSGGGSGSIYEGVDMYGGSGKDTSGMGGAFDTFFWCLIPLIFILAIMKLSGRLLQ